MNVNGSMESLTDLGRRLEAESAGDLGLGIRPSKGEPGCSFLCVFTSEVK